MPLDSGSDPSNASSAPTVNWVRGNSKSAPLRTSSIGQGAVQKTARQVAQQIARSTSIQLVSVQGSVGGKYAIEQANRSDPIGNVGLMGNTQLRPGDNAVVLSSGANNQPMIIGQSTWISGA